MATANSQPCAHQPLGDDSALSHLEISPEEPLTCIHQRIHCAATPDAMEETNELDRVQIDHFLGTLADIALSVAHRKEQLRP